MIFGGNYDKALWIILNNDKKNKELILEFLKDIPVSIYKEMLSLLGQYNINKDNDLSLVRYIHYKKYRYYFEINPMDDSINIGKFCNMNLDKNEIFLLKLCTNFDINNINGKTDIGHLIHQKKNDVYENVWECDSASYNLFKTYIGLVMVKHLDYSVCFSNRLKLVSCDKMPLEISIDNIEENIKKKKRIY